MMKIALSVSLYMRKKENQGKRIPQNEWETMESWVWDVRCYEEKFDGKPQTSLNVTLMSRGVRTALKL